MKYISDNLKDFDDVISAFLKFKNGGYWIKKIDKKGLDIYEIVEGPYSKETAQDISENYLPKYILQGYEKFSEVYTFINLLLSKSLLKDTEENIWYPPKGIFIFAIAQKLLDITVYKKTDLEYKDFKKFMRYGEINNVTRIDIRDYLIFYNNKKTESYIKAKNIYRLIRENPEISEENIDKIIKNYIMKEQENVSIMPSYLSEYVKGCELITLNFFKKYTKEKNPLQSIFNHLNECLNEKSIFTQSIDNNSIEISIETDLIINEKDYKPKKIFFIYDNSSNQYSFQLGNYGADYYIKLEENNIIIELPKERKKWNKFLITDFSSDSKFNNLQKILALFLFICKSIGKEKLNINDTRSINCQYQNEDLPIYINIIRELADYPSIYEELEFYRQKEKEFKKIINKYKNIKLKDLELEKKIDKNLEEKTLSELSKDYLQGLYKYPEKCLVVSLVSKILYEKTKSCCSKFTGNLKSKNYNFYKNKFI